MPKGDTLNDPKIREKFLEAIEIGMPYEEAAKLVGVHYSTFNHWKNQSQYNQMLIENARARMINKNLSIIQKAAEKRSWQAACWLLERRAPEHFAQILKTPDDGKLEKLVESLEKVAKNK
jgi:transposase